MDSKPSEISVTVDVALLCDHDDGPHVLLVQRGNDPYAGDWALPGGFLDPDDPDLPTAAARELREETGVTVSPDMFAQLRAYGDDGRDPRGRTVSVAYIARMPEGAEPVSGDDAADARLWPFDDLPPLAFDHDRILDDAVAWWRRSGRA